jgi:hypothetical protein
MPAIRVRTGNQEVEGEAVTRVGAHHVGATGEIADRSVDVKKKNFTTKADRAVTAMMLRATSAAANRGDRKCRNWMSGLILCRIRRVWNRSLRKFA